MIGNCSPKPATLTAAAAALLLIAVATTAAGQAASPAGPATRPAPFNAEFAVAAVATTPEGTRVERQADERLLRLTVDRPPAQPWLAQAVARSTGDVRAGDLLLVSLEVRAVTADPVTGEAALQVVVQRAEPPWRDGDEALIVVSPAWQTHEIPLRVAADLPAGKLQLAINFGLCRQVVEVRNVGVVNLGARESASGLRRPPPTYAGREPDAPWRAAAAERIDRLRKADLRVRVTDAQGQPVAGVTVRATLKQHAFPFGTAVVTRRLLGDSPDDRRYRDILTGRFNAAVFESDMKWPQWEQGDPAARKRRRAEVLRAVDWLRAEGLSVRGHALVWPGWGEGKAFVPPDVIDLAGRRDADALRRRMAARIADAAGAFSGRVDEWDVVNEPLHNRRLQDVLGDAALHEWFVLARRADPAARLYLNEFAMLSYGALDGAKLDALYDLVRRVKDGGAPIDGLGEQAHFREILVAPARMLATLDRFATLGLPIRITEFDVVVDDEQLQADYVRDFLTAAFSHPAVNGVLMWGFWEGQHAAPRAALWRRDWSPKPAALAYEDLVLRQWHTDGVAQTDSAGEVAFRGFAGRYELTAMRPGESAARTIDLPLGGATIELRLRPDGR